MPSQSKVIICLPVLLMGGTEIQTLGLVRVLINAGYKVTICCYYEFNDTMVSNIKAACANVILMKLKHADGLISLLIGMKRLFRELKPDIVHVQYIAPGLIPVLAAKLAGIKTVFATVHQPGRVYGWKEKLLLRTAAKLCTAIFCNSKAVEVSWFGDSEIFDPNKNYKKRKHFTIYNAVDIDHIEKIIQDSDPQKIRNDLGLNDKAVIGFVGRLRWEKGVDVLLEAMPEVIRKIPKVILLVVGDGPDRMNLELRAKNLWLESNILWLGQKTPDEVLQLYSIMDVVVVPSRFEGFGLSAAEAMAAGVPVIASAVDGLMEVIEDGVSGYIVPLGDIKRFNEALIELVSEPEKAKNMGEKGKEIVAHKYSYQHFKKLSLAVYENYI